MSLRAQLLLTASAILLASPACAQSGERDRQSAEAVGNLEAYAVYKMGQYPEALARWTALAEAGNTTAMINLANMHQQGQGVPKDAGVALGWTRKAAERGDARAEYDMGMAHERGVVIARDAAEAERWFRRAAARDHADAQFALAVMLATNRGAGVATTTAQQRAEAKVWLTKSAAGGNGEAAALLRALP